MHYVYKKQYNSGKFYYGYHEGTHSSPMVTDYVRNYPSVFTDGYTGSGTGKNGQILHESNNPNEIVTMTIEQFYYTESAARSHEADLISKYRSSPYCLNRT